MIRTYDNAPVAVVERPQEICPRCKGNGEIAVQRLFGRSAPEPYLVETCSSCSGTGSVDAEAVVFCDGCKDPFWADEVCRHQGVPLCVDCRPAGVCRDCVDERAERAGEYR